MSSSKSTATAAASPKKPGKNKSTKNKPVKSAPSQSDEANMSPAERERLEKIRAQFDRAPYPNQPLEAKPTAWKLYQHCLVTAYHRRNQKLIDTQGKKILDVGCGSGFGMLTLALANPGTTLVGVDLSPASLDMAQKRMEHHGFGDRCRFEVVKLEELDKLLPEKFDFINCDELLYLQPDPAVGLKSMQSILADDGIIRTNLHSAMQRTHFFRAQELARSMGLMQGNPGQKEVQIFRQLFESLKPTVPLRQQTWRPEQADSESYYMMNYLFHEDRGFTIAHIFDCLTRAGLDWIGMVDWQTWRIEDLMNEATGMPDFLQQGLAQASEAAKLHVHDLLASSHRLLDFYCGQPNAASEWLPVDQWEPDDWQTAKISLNPQLNTDLFKQSLSNAVTYFQDLQLRPFFNTGWGINNISGALVIGLVPLMEGTKTFAELVDYWQKVNPVDPGTLAPTTVEQASAPLRHLLKEMARWGYVLPERMNA
ncbi:MAG: methyltransferase domain-containing protein [Cyanobacteria bacterium P01_D01_bin.73]